MSAFSHRDFGSPDLDTFADKGAWTSAVIHRLLSLGPPQVHALLPTNAWQIQEACRLGSLLFMVSVWRCLGVGPLAADTLLTKLRNVVENSDDGWGELGDLKLWVVSVGAVEALGGPLEAWFLGQLVALCACGGITSWSECMHALSNVLWIPCVFGDKAALLEKMMRCRL